MATTSELAKRTLVKVGDATMEIVISRPVPEDPPTPHVPDALGDRSMWHYLAVVLIGATLVLFMHRPSLESLSSTLPGNLGDPALTTWILSWEWHAITTEPTRFFNGNILHPFGEAIKYSDTMLPLVPFYGTISALTGSPLLAHNLTLLGLSLFCLTTTYLLAERLIGRSVAWVAAISFSFSGFVFMHQTHLPLLTLGLFPLAFLWLFRALERQRASDGVMLGIVSALLATGSLYFGAAWFVCMFTVAIGDLASLRKPNRAWWLTMGSAALVALSLLGPIAYIYSEFQRRVPIVRDMNFNVLSPIDFVTPAPRSFLYEPLYNWANAKSTTGLVEHGFFLGFCVMALSFAGLFLLVRERMHRSHRGRTDRGLYEIGLLGLAGGAALLLALGPVLGGFTLPFRLFSEFVPGFDSIRAISRLAVPSLLALAMLAAWGLHQLLNRAARKHRVVVVGLISTVIMVEMSVVPIRADVDEPAPIRAVLGEAAPGAVIELPMREIPDSDFSYTEGPRLLASIGDWRPRFNGLSGGFPPGYLENISVISQFPAPEALERIADLGIRYVVLHGAEKETRGSYPIAQIEQIVTSLPADASVQRIGSDWLIDLG
jgi:hypothetical protein